jgi:hypothetical protein
MSTLQVNTIQTRTPAGTLAIRDSNDALTAIQSSAVRGTGAATAPVFQDSAGTEIGTLCRAWVNFDGTGTVAIRAAFNVSSITDWGIGRYQLNFTNALASNSYMTLATSGTSVDDSAALTLWERTSNKNTIRVEVNSTYSTATANGYSDYPGMNVAVFQ